MTDWYTKKFKRLSDPDVHVFVSLDKKPMTKEAELRKWLVDNTSPKTTIQWVEPGRYGSTMGAADAIVKKDDKSVSLELKIWERKKKGIKCAMRPVQRRWHRQTMRQGGKCAVLFCLQNTNDIFLLRGDRVPLRDYAEDENSGCPRYELRYTRVSNDLENLLFDMNDTYHFWI